MNQTATDQKTRSLLILFMSVYFTSYVTRLNYGAVISEISRQEQILKSTASLALTGSAVTYGLGQLLSGYMGDKIQPKNVMLAGLVTTILMNISMAFCTNPYQMAVVWSINGLAQAFMWPPLIKNMSSVFTEEEYKKAVILVSWGSSLGTVMVYLLSPLFIHLGGWRLVFLASALLASVMAVIWYIECPVISLNAGVSEETGAQAAFPWSLMMAGILAVIVLQGYLRDGVATWLPSLIFETFNLSTNISILTGIVFPMFNILIYYMVLLIYRKAIRNELALSGLFFIIGAVFAVLLALLREKNIALTVITSSMVIAAMHGVNLIMISMLPRQFSKFKRISLISGLFNSFTYLGSALSAFGMAAYIERFGWKSMVFFWGAVALTGGGISLALVKKWRRFSCQV